MQHYDLVSFPFDIKFFFAISLPSSLSVVRLKAKRIFIKKS